jgi:hypothetical protein
MVSFRGAIMKRIIIIICVFLLGFLSMVLAKDESEKKKSEDKKIIVYYFYTNFRCASCHKIENYTKEAIEKYFKDELKSGKLVFKAINVEEKENEHFVKDYKLYTKSVVLSLVKNNKEVKYNNLAKVWNYLKDKKKFYGYIKKETDKYLKELK